MVKSSYVIKAGLSRQFCSEKLLQICRNIFQLQDFVGEIGKDWRSRVLSIEQFSPNLLCLLNIKILGFRGFFPKQSSFLLQEFKCRSMKFLNSNGYRIQRNTEQP